MSEIENDLIRCFEISRDQNGVGVEDDVEA